MFKYGIFSLIAPDWTCEELAPLLAQLGYSGVEWRVFNSKRMGDAWNRLPAFWSANKNLIEEDEFVSNARYYRDLCDKSGIEIAAIGSYIECDDIPTAERVMRACADAGIGAMRISPKAYNGKIPYRTLFEQSEWGYSQINELSKKYHVKVLLEMHGGSLSSSASAALRLIGKYSPKQFGVIYDTGCVLQEGYEKFAIDMLGEYLAHTHIKNMGEIRRVKKEDGTFKYVSDQCSIWDGRYDLENFLKELDKAGYKVFVNFEDFSTLESNYDKLVHNIAYMKGLEQKLGLL